MITALPSLMVKAQPKNCSDSTSLLGEGQFTCVGINLPFCGSLQIFLFVEKLFLNIHAPGAEAEVFEVQSNAEPITMDQGR
jgi:hypothetical protein